MNNILYTVEKDCPICGGKFPVTKVRNKLTMIRQDADFCTHYQEINPYFYAVWVCPGCGYAGQDAFFHEVSPAAEEKIRKFLSGRAVNVNFSGERTVEQAIATYKLAIFFGEMTAILPSRLAGLYLKIGWLYRETGQEREEAAALDKARENYEQALLKERLPIGNMTELTVEYLIGELYRRTGKIEEALSYLGKIVSNPGAKAEKRILELAKEAWHAAREARKQPEAKK